VSGDLRQALRDVVSNRELPHVERLTLVSAILSAALERAGMEAMLVGGGAIEFYAPQSYTTADIDLVVDRATREKLAPVFESLGLSRKDRHWLIGDIYVEVPGFRIDEPYEQFTVGPFQLRVIRKEIVLAERIIGFRYWKVWAYGVQAIDMIATFGAELDESVLRKRLREDQAEAAYELLREVGVSSEEPVTPEFLDRLWHSRYR
jgi:hypothetical protein